MHQALTFYDLAGKEAVPLFTGVTAITIETDASLSGYAFCARITGTDIVLFSETQTALTLMKEQHWHCNRTELTAILLAARRLAERLDLLPELGFVLFETDSMVAAAHCNLFARPDSGSIEGTALLRLGAVVCQIFKELTARKIGHAVRHIQGVSNLRADRLSRIPETGFSEKWCSGHLSR